MEDRDKDRPEKSNNSTEGSEPDPRQRFQQMSHIAITMSYDLIDKLRFFEKETLKLSDEEIAGRAPHVSELLSDLRTAYVKFAEVDF